MTAAGVGQMKLEGLREATRPRSRLMTPAGRRFLWAACAAGVASLAFVIQNAFHIGGDDVTTAIDDIGEAVAAVIAAVSCGWAATHSVGRLRLAWASLAPRRSAGPWARSTGRWSRSDPARSRSPPPPMPVS